MATAYLNRQARQARELIGPFSPEAIAVLQAEAATLPSRCELFNDALHQSKARSANPLARVCVAKVVIALREAGVIDEHLAAAALVDLSSPHSALCESAIRHAKSSPRASAPMAAPVTV